MRGLPAIVLALGLARIAAAQGGAPLTSGNRAFVEVETARATVWVQEPFRVTVRIGVDRRFFEDHVVSLFRRPMDVPVQLRAPWLTDLPGTSRLAMRLPEVDTRRASFALNDDVVEAARTEDRVVDGRTFTVLLLERTYLPVRAGEIRIGAAELRFAYGTEFEEDFVHGRRATDRREATVRSEAIRIRVTPLPTDGRPAGFAGAVGRFRVSAATTAREVEPGESFRLTLRIEGPGNLGGFEPPDLAGLEGFHVLGRIDDRGWTARTIGYDLTPTRGDLDRVPPIGLAHFDPGPPARYRVARTEPIPLVVRTRTGASEEPAAEEPPALPVDEAPGERFPWVPAVLVTAVLGGLLALWLRRRAVARTRPDPVEERSRKAREAFRAASDPADALAAFLAVHLGCAPAAVISPELAARLEGAGVPPELAARTAGRLEVLVAARYGGEAPEDAAAASRSLVDELTTVLTAGTFS